METEPATTGVVETAYERYRAALIGYAAALTRDAVAAEDLVQDAFVRLTVEVAAGRTPDHTGAWLHRVVHNLAMSRGRRVTVADRRRADLCVSDEQVSPEHIVMALEHHREVESVVADLDPVHREALAMAAVGYGNPEIARSIGKSTGATRTLLCRARARVRTQFTTRAAASMP